jgi:hypothetical protein
MANEAAVPDFKACTSLAECHELAKRTGFAVKYVIDCKGGRKFMILDIAPPIGSLQPAGAEITITRAAVPEDVIKVGDGMFQREVHICELDDLNRDALPKSMRLLQG